MKLFKSIALSAALASSAYAGTQDMNRVLVIGDSLSASGVSWPTYIEGNVHCLCQGGRTIKSYDVPRDLWVPGKELAVYALGTNDAWQWQAYATQATLANHLDVLKQRGLLVVVVLPPSAPMLRPVIGDVRKALKQQANKRNLPVIDLNKVWDVSKTTDGLHPNKDLSRIVGQYMQQQLDTIIYLQEASQ